MKKTFLYLFTFVSVVSIMSGCGKAPSAGGEDGGGSNKPDTKVQYFYNPVLYENERGEKWALADPSIWKGEDGKYYGVATHIENVMVSDDMINWSYKRDAINESLRSKYVGLTGDYPNGYFYAPDVVSLNGTRLMYVRIGNQSKSAVAVFRELSSPGDFHFEFMKYLIKSDETYNGTDKGLSDSSDPEVVVGEDGRVWLFYGGSQGIHRIELTSNGLDIKEGSTLTHVAGNRESTFSSRDDRYEGCYLYHRNGYWYMFASAGMYSQPNYCLVVGRSTALDGEFVDHYGNKLTDANAGNLIGAKRILKSGSDDQFWGPGHNGEIFSDKLGQDYIFYHCHDDDKDNHNGYLRYLMLQRLFWDEDGWPYFTDDKPAWRDVKPTL